MEVLKACHKGWRRVLLAGQKGFIWFVGGLGYGLMIKGFGVQGSGMCGNSKQPPAEPSNIRLRIPRIMMI